MIPLRSALSDYLSTRRSLGYKLRRTEKLLLQFIDYVEANCADRIATDLALSWARLPVGGDVSWWSSRLTVVRKLCPTLRTKRISAHTLRHTAAMQLLHAGVDTSVIALWLGTSRSTPPRSIYMPISASRSEPSRGQS